MGQPPNRSCRSKRASAWPRSRTAGLHRLPDFVDNPPSYRLGLSPGGTLEVNPANKDDGQQGSQDKGTQGHDGNQGLDQSEASRVFV